MSNAAVAGHFDDAAQQRQAAGLGMWAFLGTEILFFGGLFTVYAVYRMLNADAFAEASRHLYMWLAAINTSVLLTSSFTMALAVHAAGRADRHRTVRFLLITALLAAAFLVLKLLEYFLDYRDNVFPGDNFRTDWRHNAAHAQLFFVLYFVTTALHAAHMIIGIGVMLVLAATVDRTTNVASKTNSVEMTGLYWHFVDIVWIFLFPLYYLIDRHGSH